MKLINDDFLPDLSSLAEIFRFNYCSDKQPKVSVKVLSRPFNDFLDYD